MYKLRTGFCLLFLWTVIVIGCIPFQEQPRLSPEEAKTSFVLGKQCYSEGNYPDAIIEFSSVATGSGTPYADDAQFMLAKCWYALGNYARAAKEAENLGRRFPDSRLVDSANLLVAESYSASGDPLKAAVAYLNALKMASTEKKKDSVLKELERLVEKLPLKGLYALRRKCENSRVEPIVLLSIGEKEMKRGERETARAVLDRLLRMDTDAETMNRARRLLKFVGSSVAIKIGLIAPLSGEYSIYGDALRKGVELALSGHGKLGLVLFDSKGDPIEAVRGVRELVQEQNVIAIIGPVFTKTVIPAAIAADYLDIPLISPTATDERISSLGKCVFQLDTGLRNQVEELAAYSVREMGLKKAAIIYPEDGYGRSLSQLFSRETRKLGGETLISIGYESGKTDFRYEIDILKEYLPDTTDTMDTVDVIFIPAYVDDVIMIATQLRFYEVDLPLLGANGWKSDRLLALAREYVEGAIFTAFDLNADSAQISREFTRKYKDRYAEDPMRQSAQGFDAGRLVTEAVSSGMDNPYLLRDYLNSRSLSVGVSGLIYTAEDPASHVARLYSVRRGRMEEVR